MRYRCQSVNILYFQLHDQWFCINIYFVAVPVLASFLNFFFFQSPGSATCSETFYQEETEGDLVRKLVSNATEVD